MSDIFDAIVPNLLVLRGKAGSYHGTVRGAAQMAGKWRLRARHDVLERVAAVYQSHWNAHTYPTDSGCSERR